MQYPLSSLSSGLYSCAVSLNFSKTFFSIENIPNTFSMCIFSHPKLLISIYKKIWDEASTGFPLISVTKFRSDIFNAIFDGWPAFCKYQNILLSMLSEINRKNASNSFCILCFAVEYFSKNMQKVCEYNCYFATQDVSNSFSIVFFVAKIIRYVPKNIKTL